MASYEIIQFALSRRDANCAWVAPWFKQAKIVYRLIRKAFAKTGNSIIARKSDSELRFEFKNGSVIQFFSAENYDSLRGDGYHFLVIDEAADALKDPKMWTDAIRPALSDTGGVALIIGTPKGRNLFFQLFNRGDDPEYPDWACFHAVTSDNPYIPPEEIETAKKELPEDTYQQEYEAQFLEESAGVFRRIEGVLKGTLNPDYVPEYGHQYILGWDPAKYQDYSVLTLMDIKTCKVVWWDRFHHSDYTFQVKQVVQVAKRFNNAFVYMDSTGAGDVVFELLKENYPNCDGYVFTNPSKKILIETLQLGIQDRAFEMPDIPVVVNELRQFEYKISPSRNVIYGAPDGCFLAGTPILLASGCALPIDVVFCNDAVITHIGEEHKVYKTMERHYEGEIIEIKASGIPYMISTTTEHPFWARKRTSKHLQRYAARKEYPAEWIEAKDLSKGDWLAVPKRVGLEPTEYTDEQLYAIGFWLAEGNLIKGWNNDIRGIALYNTDKSLLERAANALEAMFPEDEVKRGNDRGVRYVAVPSQATTMVRQRTETRADRSSTPKPCYEWKLRSRAAGLFFEQFTASKSDQKGQKFLPEDFYKHSGLLSVVAGFIDGDGSQRKNQGFDVNFYTVSSTLAWQLRQILIDSNIWCTLRETDRGEKWQTMWTVNIKGSYLHLLPKCKVVVPENLRLVRHVMEDDKYFYTPIQSIQKRDYSGPVYNFSVEGDNSYVAGGVAVHNCHDDCVISLALAWYAVQSGLRSVADEQAIHAMIQYAG